MNIKLSVIVPVYNSEEFLAKAIESVINQSFKNWELLLIDDGSTDNSGLICDQYAKNDERIQVYHRTNSGQCAVRNWAFKICKGDYITFLDNDDIFLDDVFEQNLKLAEEYNADIVKFGFIVEETDKNLKEIRKRHIKSKLIIRENENSKYYAQARESGYFSSVWNGIYKRKFILNNQLKFNESLRFGYEDCIFNFMCYEKAKVQVINPEIGYYYYQRYNHSTFKKFNENKIDAWKYMVKCEYDLYKKYEQDKEFALKWEKQAITSLLDLMNIISAKNCTYTNKQKILLIKSIHKEPEFSTITKQAIASIEMKRTQKLFADLFIEKKYIILLWLLKVYKIWILLKRKKNNLSISKG